MAEFTVILAVSEAGSKFFAGQQELFIGGSTRCWSFPDPHTGIAAVYRLLDKIRDWATNESTADCSAVWFVNQQPLSSLNWLEAMNHDGVAVVIDLDARVPRLYRIAKSHERKFDWHCRIESQLPDQAVFPDFPLLELFETMSLG